MLIWMIFLGALAQVCHADAFTAKVYTLDSKNPKLLYSLVGAETHEGSHTKILAVYNLPDGKPAASESAEIEGGDEGHLLKYTANQEIPSQHGVVEIRGGRAYFSYDFGGGKKKTDDEKASDPLIAPPTTVSFIRANWDAIAKGDTVETRLAAVERCETVGFKFFKSGDEKRGGRDVMLVTMKPTSFIIAAIVSPMTFVFDKTSHKILEFRGRILPKRDGKDQDADIIYDN